VAGTAMLAVYGAMWGGEDDDGEKYWDKIPDHVKERNLVIMMPPGMVDWLKEAVGAEVQTVGKDGAYLTIPIQYGLNIFSTLGYAIADTGRNALDPMQGRTPIKAAMHVLSTTLGTFNPVGGSVDTPDAMAMMMMPTIMDVPYQFMMGVDGFGKPTAPRIYGDEEEVVDSERVNARQADGPFHHLARWVNTATGGDETEKGFVDMTPGTYENVWRNLTGGTGRFITDVAALTIDGVDAALGGSPDVFTKDVPILRKVLGKVDGDTDQTLFYDRREQIKAARAEEKRKADAGLDMTDNKKVALAGMSTQANRITRELADIRRQLIELQQNDSLTKVQKGKEEKELKALRDELLADFHATWREEMKWALTQKAE
jgi:hypothetical protein